MEKKSLRTKKIISYKNMGDKLSIVSNTCHLCKSIITLEDFHPCKNKIIYNTKSKKNKSKKAKFCNKIFCINCYEKYFPNYIINSEFNLNLNCPSCEGLCFCKICVKNKEKQDLEDENLILLGQKRCNSVNNNKKNKQDNINLRIQKLANKIKSIFPNIDSECKLNKEKNTKIIPLIDPSEFGLIKQYNLNLNKIINNIKD